MAVSFFLTIEELIPLNVNKLFTADVVKNFSGYIGTALKNKNNEAIGVRCALSFDELKLPIGAKENGLNDSAYENLDFDSTL